MPTQMPSDKGYVVIVIEHENFLGDALLKMLKAAGYRCHFIHDEKNSIDAIKELKPDLVVLDMSWPAIDGYEILEAKRADRSVAFIPVIALSTEPGNFDLQRAKDLGVNDNVVNTTIDPNEVVDKVNAYFRSSSSTRTSQDTPSNSKEISKEKSAQRPLQDKKILWVEDDKFLGNILKKRMTTSGCLMTLATNGQEALAYISKDTPHVIVLDLVLPGMSGFDILKKIKDSQNCKDVPVLILSNLNQTGDIERAKILGADKFLVKASVSLDEIVKEVQLLAR